MGGELGVTRKLESILFFSDKATHLAASARLYRLRTLSWKKIPDNPQLWQLPKNYKKVASATDIVFSEHWKSFTKDFFEDEASRSNRGSTGSDAQGRRHQNDNARK